jgi:hypothetical protein
MKYLYCIGSFLAQEVVPPGRAEERGGGQTADPGHLHRHRPLHPPVLPPILS